MTFLHQVNIITCGMVLLTQYSIVEITFMRMTLVTQVVNNGDPELMHMVLITIIQRYGRDELEKLYSTISLDEYTPWSVAVTPWSQTTDQRRKALVELLVNVGGVDIDRRHNDLTMMHQACEYGFLDIVKFFVKKNIDVNVEADEDSDGVTPLICAAVNNHLDVAKYLLEATSADIEKGDKQGFTALTYACFKSHLKMVQLLIDHGADVFATDNVRRSKIR